MKRLYMGLVIMLAGYLPVIAEKPSCDNSGAVLDKYLQELSNPTILNSKYQETGGNILNLCNACPATPNCKEIVAFLTEKSPVSDTVSIEADTAKVSTPTAQAQAKPPLTELQKSQQHATSLEQYIATIILYVANLESRVNNCEESVNIICPQCEGCIGCPAPQPVQGPKLGL